MPPAYATQADVEKAAGGATRLLQIADHDDDGVIDTGLVDDALLEAEATINTYARKVFAVPFLPVPESIKRTAANLAVWVLKSRRDALTEADMQLHEKRMKWLEDLSRGLVDPGSTDAASPSAHNRPAATDRPSDKAISRENLKGFA